MRTFLIASIIPATLVLYLVFTDARARRRRRKPYDWAKESPWPPRRHHRR